VFKDFITNNVSALKKNFFLYFRYSRDLEEICEMMTTSKSQLFKSSGIEDLYHSPKFKFDTDSSHMVL
jgi:hypothetical protein